MKIHALSFIAVAFLFCGSASADTEWIHRTLMGNSLPTPKCAAEAKAKELASKPNTIKDFAKQFCSTQGYGWALEEVKDNGKLVCNQCEGDKGADTQQCHLEDIVAECRRIKPGSVGMLPGKG